MTVSEQLSALQFFCENVKVILFNGVKGGTGKTTICSNCANLLSQDHTVGVIDADIDSPNFAPTLGLTGVMEQNGERLFIPAKYNDNLKVFSMTLFTGDTNQAFTKRGTQNQNIISDAIKYTDWGAVEYLLIDLPAGSGDEFRVVRHILTNIIGQVVVTLPNTTDDLLRCIDISSRFNIPIIGVVENMAYVPCEECGHDNHLYGLDEETSKVREICDEYNLRYFGQLPYIPELHVEDEEDSFIVPDEDIGIIENIMEAIYGKQTIEDQDYSGSGQGNQATV
jgi:ATP-binding protein involved in chromosome partitioning